MDLPGERQMEIEFAQFISSQERRTITQLKKKQYKSPASLSLEELSQLSFLIIVLTASQSLQPSWLNSMRIASVSHLLS